MQAAVWIAGGFCCAIHKEALLEIPTAAEGYFIVGCSASANLGIARRKVRETIFRIDGRTNVR